jgi:hypothetical protein
MSKQAIGALRLQIKIAKDAIPSAMADVENATTRLERATKRLAALNADIEVYMDALRTLGAEPALGPKS